MPAIAHTRTELADLLSAGPRPDSNKPTAPRRTLRIDADGLERALRLTRAAAPVCAVDDRPKKRVLSC